MYTKDALRIMTVEDVAVFNHLPETQRRRVIDAWRYDEGERLSETVQRLGWLGKADAHDVRRAIRRKGGFGL